MSDRTFRQLLQVANHIAARATDSSGFVPLAALAREVQADVRFRPLLVEGVAAQPKARDGRWLILIDSETHRVTDEMLAAENANHPLGARVRNTVAHELAHALGPRCEEIMGGASVSRKEVIEILERETEQLSPALLIPQRSLEALVKARSEPIDIEELASARDMLGVSSRVLVKRFGLLAHESENAIRYHPRVDSIVIGSGEWIDSTRAELNPAPFRGMRGLLPEFVTLLRTHKKVIVGEHFSDANFYLNGGSNCRAEANLWTGTTAQPHSEKSLVEIAVEPVPRKGGTSFLWLARTKSTV
jgi:hypothetical protein